MDKVIESIIADIAKEYNIDRKEAEKILILPYKMMKEKVQALELKGKTFDECREMKTNFNMPGLFKMYLNEYKINELNKKKEDAES